MTARSSKIDDVKSKVYHKFLVNIENDCKKNKLETDIDIEDIYYAAREVCEWRCAITGERVTGLSLCIWDRSRKVDGSNLLLVSSKYSKVLDNKSLKDLEVSPEKMKKMADMIEISIKNFSRKMIIHTNLENNN